MTQHALRTAVTLYAGGTLDIETAAKQAGVTPARLERAAARFHVPVTAQPTPVRERLTVASD
jgi:hypothetical protein